MYDLDEEKFVKRWLCMLEIYDFAYVAFFGFAVHALQPKKPEIGRVRIIAVREDIGNIWPWGPSHEELQQHRQMGKIRVEE